MAPEESLLEKEKIIDNSGIRGDTFCSKCVQRVTATQGYRQYGWIWQTFLDICKMALNGYYQDHIMSESRKGRSRMCPCKWLCFENFTILDMLLFLDLLLSGLCCAGDWFAGKWGNCLLTMFLSHVYMLHFRRNRLQLQTRLQLLYNTVHDDLVRNSSSTFFRSFLYVSAACWLVSFLRVCFSINPIGRMWSRDIQCTAYKDNQSSNVETCGHSLNMCTAPLYYVQ